MSKLNPAEIWLVIRDDWDNYTTKDPLNRRLEAMFDNYPEAAKQRNECETPDGKPRLDSYRRKHDHAMFPQFKVFRLAEFLDRML